MSRLVRRCRLARASTERRSEGDVPFLAAGPNGRCTSPLCATEGPCTPTPGVRSMSASGDEELDVSQEFVNIGPVIRNYIWQRWEGRSR